MRRTGAWLLLVVVLACAGSLGCAPEKGEAKARVETVLGGLERDENSSEYLAALCQWYAGRDSIRADDLEVAQDQLNRWLGSKSLALPLRDHAVKGVELRDGGGGKEAIVRVMVNGRPMTIKAVAGETLEWAD